MSYVGKVCPYCKSELKEDDDVVICSVCEMPHHKECWIENKACTTFGCTGTIMGTDNQSNDLFCKKCGSVHKDGDRFCSQCGNSLLNITEQQPQYAHPQVPPQYLSYMQPQYTNQTVGANYNQPNNSCNSYNNISNDVDLQTFISKNVYYFLKRFQNLSIANEKASWNWASAFLGGYWYGYRKMYRNQLLYYGIAFLGIFIPLLYLVLFVLSGIFGNYLYKCHVEKHVQIARNMEPHMKQNYLTEKGGTSSVAVWIIIMIRVVLFILIVLAAVAVAEY